MRTWHCILAALLILSARAGAQEAPSALEHYLGNDRPALLFEATTLSINDIQGGIGVLFSPSSTFHIPVVIVPIVTRDNRRSIDQYENGEIISGDVKSTGIDIGIIAAPYWVLTTEEEFCFTAGPLLGYSILYSSREASAFSDKNGFHYFSNDEGIYNHRLQIGFTAGAGYAYRLTGESMYWSSKFTDRRFFRISAWKDWRFRTAGSLTLGVRL